MTIKVTREHIKKGTAGDNFWDHKTCPIGLAAKDMGAQLIWVNKKRWVILLKDKTEIRLPESVVEIHDRMAHGKSVRPFSFRVRVR